MTRRELLGAAAAGGLVLAGCGESKTPSAAELEAQGRAAAKGVRYDGPPVELTFWNGFTGGDGPFMLEFVDAFNRSQDRISIRMNVILWVDYYQKTTSAVATGNGPDLGVMQIQHLPTAAAHSTIVPLDDVATAMDLREQDFPEPVWRAGMVGGKRFGIPLDVHPLGLYINEGVFKEAGLDPASPPRDRQGYLEACEAMKAKGIQGSWVSPFLFTGVLMFESLLAQFGGSMYDPEGRRATWDSDAGVEALSFMRDLVRKGYSLANVGQDADAIAWKNSENAMIWNGCWAINEYAGLPDLKWRVTEAPRIGSEPGVWGSSHQFVLMRQGRGDDHRLQAAAAFIDYVSRRSLDWAKAGMVPARRSVREGPEFEKEYAKQAVFARELDYVRFPPPVAGIDDVREAALDPAVNQTVLLQEEPRTALRDAAKRGNALLADNRRKYGV